MSLDFNALNQMSYGLYAVTSMDGARPAGCIANTCFQVTAEPPVLAVCINRDNHTHGAIEKTGRVAISVIAQSEAPLTIGTLGFRCGRDVDKFASIPYEMVDGLPVLKSAVSCVTGTVIGRHELSTHTLFFLTADEARMIAGGEVMTYDYYHKVVKGKTPKNATTYVPPEALKESLPVRKSLDIQKAEIKEEKVMKKFVCPVCGYVHEGDCPPEKCPVCGVAGSKVIEQAQGKVWASEHVIGVAKDVDEEIKEGLRANFVGECTEVGMYLAMARAAHREGYPEIGLYWEKAAFEEAEHAAKFAELLGEVVSPSTKENLTVRVEAENGATMGKTELAKKAKALGLDAIHDTVHEMARDEARHGKAFEGLLNRYFGK